MDYVVFATRVESDPEELEGLVPVFLSTSADRAATVRTFLAGQFPDGFFSVEQRVSQYRNEAHPVISGLLHGKRGPWYARVVVAALQVCGEDLPETTGGPPPKEEVEALLARLLSTLSEGGLKRAAPKRAQRRTKREKIREQRLAFCRPRFKKGISWQDIYVAYHAATLDRTKRLLPDPKASADALRLMYNRNRDT